MKLKSVDIILSAIFCVALLFRVVTVMVLDIPPESDYAAYQLMAQNFLSGNGFTDGENQAFMSAGYPLLVLVPVFALTGNSLLAAQLVNAFLGAITVLICYFVARRAGAGRVAGLVAASLLTLYIPSWIYAEYIAKENLMAPLMLGIIWCALGLAKKASYTIAALSGLLFGLLALTGNAALSIGGAVLVALAFSKTAFGRKVVSAGIIGVIAVAILTPWLVRNYHVVGAPVINSNSGFNLYVGNNPSATGYFVSIADTPAGSQWHALRKEHGELGASRILGVLAIDWIKDHPTEALVLSLKKAAVFWMPPIHGGKGDGSRAETVSRLIWLVQFVILTSASVASLAFRNLRTRSLAILWLAVIGYTAVHMLFYVVFRYREPIMPLLCILSALSFEQLWRVAQQRKNVAVISTVPKVTV
jgi:4-amino-4-deoxy-L-arabinose transferase-like glycosyltransferase